MPLLFSRRTYFIVLAFLCVVLVATLIHRAEYFDDAWFAEQSFWLLRDGYVRSELFRDYNGWHNGLYVFHKLFIYAGALVMGITGVTVWTSKLVSLFFGLLGALLVWQYGRRTSAEQGWLALWLYLGCGTWLRFTSANRPETMYMAFGFASYLFLERPQNARPKAAWAGAMAGLSALTHLNGVVYLIAGGLWLLLRRDWRSVWQFALAGGLVTSLYFLDALLAGKLDVLIQQFIHDPATQQNMGIGSKLLLLLNFQQIFFHSQNEAALTVLVLLCAIAFRKKIRLTDPLVLYTLLLIGSFWLLTKSITDIYYLIFMPFLVSLTAMWLLRFLPEAAVWQRKTARVLLVGYLVITAIQLRFIVVENWTTPDIEAHNRLLSSHMPLRHSRIIAPLEFFFGQVDNYQIQGLTAYSTWQSEGRDIPLNRFFQLADERRAAYIISDHRLNASYDIPPSAPARIGNYQRIFQDKWNTIYARVGPHQ